MSPRSLHPVRHPSSRWTLLRWAIACVLSLGLTYGGLAPASGDGERATTDVTVTATTNEDNERVTEGFQGFSVESADFAHGYLTEERMSERLQTLGRHGVIRLGGYSMDLVWPAFGRWSDAPAPPQAIGGTVDQGDLDNLKELLDDSGWKVTLGLPLKAIIDPAKVKSPTKDPAPAVTLEQAVAEVKAAHETLGDDLLGVEVGNEYDNVTTLTGAEMWATMKRYQAAIKAAAPDARLKMVGPSANTARTNFRLDEFVTAALADTSAEPKQVMEELSSHWYPGSHCGSSTMTIEQLMSTATYTNTRTKLTGMMAIADRLVDAIPSTINESNSASCSGMPGVSNSYATALWSLDYQLQTAQSGVSRLQFHTNTAAICGDFKPRDSADYPVSYRYYGAFCADDQEALDAGELSATPLYYGIWAFRQVPEGKFVDLDLDDSQLDKVRAYGIQGKGGELTMVVINVQDPAKADSTQARVTLRLPASYAQARAVTLQTSAPEGLASLDSSRVSLGGQTVAPTGTPSGTPQATPVMVDHTSSTITVVPGTAQIVTFEH